MVTTETPAPSVARRSAGFWLVAVSLFLLMFAASAPSPLYVVYQRMWDFTPATLTAVFAIYVIALLVMLLTIGSLSDYVGRRPVLIASLAAEAASMVLFIVADGTGWLYAARILQGIATGAATGAISASLIDLEPRPGSGSLVNSIVPTAGLAIGAFGTGLLVELAAAPTRLVYVLLLVAFVVVTIATWFLPEPVTRRPGVLRSLRPELGIPPAGRKVFLVVLPSFVVPWALAGLYLSLGRSLVVDILHVDNPIVGGLVIALMLATGSLSSLLLRNRDAGKLMTAGALSLGGGAALLLAALSIGSLALFLIGTVVAGSGFGMTFLGSFRTITALAEGGGRAAVIATMYVASYTTFSVPAILAGFAATGFGLYPTALGYCGLLFALAMTALLTRRRYRSRERAAG